MSKSLKEYKSFIDDLVSLSESTVSNWVTGNGFPEIESNCEKNALLKSLSIKQKEILSQIINESKTSGIHDVLSYLNDKQLSGNLKIIKNDQELPIEPFDTEMNYDYIARLEKDKWPK